MKQYFITTPIYYANAKIHFGNLYTSLIADTIARSKRLIGYDVFFSTGTDENGQKMTQSAEKEGKNITEFLDDIVTQDKQEMKIGNISYNDFVRTTQDRHHKLVQSILQKTYNNGDFYQDEYEGLYCVGCESFKKEKDLITINGQLVCPDHLIPPQKIKEKNRFFRLSQYEEKLKTFYKNNPNFIQPQSRYNEVLAFIESGLEDFSISRPKKENSIGIPLPFDDNSITYIWYDALLNYLTVIVDYYDDDGNPVLHTYGQNMFHTLGKDIVRFHAVYRPAILIAAGYDKYLPQGEFVGGFFTVDGQKMSKSLGNTLYMQDLIRDYGRDATVFYLLYDIPQGSDGDFSLERLGHVYESMLLGGWGNLVSRVTKLAKKEGITHGKRKTNMILGNSSNKLWEMIKTLNLDDFEYYFDKAKINTYLQDRYQLVQEANLYIQTQAPRVKLKNPTTRDEGRADLQYLLWIIKQLALLSAPFLIESFQKVQQIFGNEELSQLNSSINLSDPTLFTKIYNLTEFPIQIQEDLLYPKRGN